jgi:hypothetical protein
VREAHRIERLKQQQLREQATMCARDEWNERFSARLRELQPLISQEQALEVASVASQGAIDMEPEVAAVEFLDVLNAGVPVKDLKRWLQRW